MTIIRKYIFKDGYSEIYYDELISAKRLKRLSKLHDGLRMMLENGKAILCDNRTSLWEEKDVI